MFLAHGNNCFSDYNIRWYVIALWFVKMFKYLVSSSVLLKSCTQKVWLYTIVHIVSTGIQTDESGVLYATQLLNEIRRTSEMVI